jgi:hypothetical protein
MVGRRASCHACPVAQDYTAAIEPVVRPLLDGDERLLAAAPLVADPGTTEDVSAGDELRNLLDPTILVGLGAHPGNALQRAVFGRAVTGGPGSTGRAVFEAVAAVSAPKLAVTNARLLILDVAVVPRGGGLWRRWFGAVDQVARVAHQVSRAGILGAVAAPAGVLRRGRFLVGFADGSGCVLVCAPPGLSRRAVEALGAPRPRPDPTA